MRSRSEWLFKRQQGRCYLKLTPTCVARDGALDPRQRSKSVPNGWTWEHVIPLSYARRLGFRSSCLKLLACQDCNGVKGVAAPPPGAIELALAYSREWFELTADAASDRGGKLSCEIIADLELLVAEYRRHPGKLPAISFDGETMSKKERRRMKRARNRANKAARWSLDDERRLRAELHALLGPAAGTGSAQAEPLSRVERATALGVTDPAYRPERKAAS